MFLCWTPEDKHDFREKYDEIRFSPKMKNSANMHIRLKGL